MWVSGEMLVSRTWKEVEIQGEKDSFLHFGV